MHGHTQIYNTMYVILGHASKLDLTSKCNENATHEQVIVGYMPVDCLLCCHGPNEWTECQSFG